MIGFLLTFCLYVTTVFLAIIPAFGISYTGAEESPIYVLTVLGTNALAICYVVCQELFHHKQAKGSIGFYLLPLLILFLYVIELAFGNLDESSSTSRLIRYFFAYSASGIIIGTYCYRFDRFDLIAKNLEPLAIICSIGLIISLPSMYVEDEMSSTIGGGGGHQTISYVAAICFGIFSIGLRLKNMDRKYSYKLFASSYYRPIALALMIANAVICIVGGGRGGAILLIVNTLATLFYFSKEKFWRTILSIAAGGAVFYFAVTNVSSWGVDEMFRRGAERAFAFIGADGKIDMSETSERDKVYAIAGELIGSKPGLGYGPFHQYDICERYISEPYCHNLFCEWLLQGGIPYFALWLVVLIGSLRRIHRLIVQGAYHLIPIVSYPLVVLMFSGTYLMMPLFWFSIVYSYGFTSRNRDRMKACYKK